MMMISKEVSAMPLLPQSSSPGPYSALPQSPRWPVSAGTMLRVHTTIMTGFSINALNALSSTAPSAPSTARWSVASPTVIICAASILPLRAIARSSAAPTERMLACGGILHLIGDDRERFLLRVAHDWRDQPARYGHRNADIGMLVPEHRAFGP